MDDTDRTSGVGVSRPGHIRAQASQANEMVCDHGEALAKLAEIQSLYRSLFDLSIDGIVVLDTRGRITRCNQAFAECMDLAPEELKGMNLGDLHVNPHDWARFLDLLEKTGSAKDFEWKTRTGIGRERECLATASSITGVGGIARGYQAVIRDVTDHKKSLEILVQTDRMKALGEMAGAVAHNIKNMLQIIVGTTRLALSNLESGNLPEVRSNLEQILTRLRSAGETARLLNHFAGVKKDKDLRGARTLDLSRVAQKAIEICRAWLEADTAREGITINIRSVLQPGCLVKGLENDLLEVAANILWNAAEALPNGGDIIVGTSIEDNYVLLEITDNGVGIPEPNLDEVFQPFWTSKGALATGLGLASSYGIVTHHGGDISIESRVGRGTRCVLRLPLAEKAFDRPEIKIQHTAGFSYRILVVDDLKPLLRILTTGLVRRGQTVFSASSGPEALEIFEKNPVDVVICDLGMPDMNGWQVCAALKRICEERGQPKPPFVILTGWGSGGDEAERIADSGVDRILEKPMDIPSLLENIRELVHERSG